jgi:hypothetical protein
VTPLVVNNKRISKSHGEFSVSAFSQDDVVRCVMFSLSSIHVEFLQLDPKTRPQVEYWNSKTDKTIVIHRAGNPKNVGNINPGATEELVDGDVVFIANSVPVTCVLSAFFSSLQFRLFCSLRWERLCVCIGRESVDLARCADLGSVMSLLMLLVWYSIVNRHRGHLHAQSRDYPSPRILLCVNAKHLRIPTLSGFLCKARVASRGSAVGRTWRPGLGRRVQVAAVECEGV